MVKNDIREALKKAAPEGAWGLSISTDEKKGHLSSNAALLSAKAWGIGPKEAAEKIKGEIEGKVEGIERIEVAGPGFLNFYLTHEAMAEALHDFEKKLTKGFDSRKGEKANIEFISANPTGELHIGHGRGAFYGDALANVLEFCGGKVTREYYVNISRKSSQIKELGKTALGKGEQYKTPELEALIKSMDLSGLDEIEAGYLLAEKIQERNREFIEEKLKISFDEWFVEEEKLHASLVNERTLAALKMKGLTYEKDGAVWLKTSEYGDDEDRVVVRSDGTLGYFLPDIAYHIDKFSRGYDMVIDVLGADHQGHVRRMQAVRKMFGWKGELKVFISQLVTLKHGEDLTKMSKRAGNVVYLRDLVEEFGLDVVRWFYGEKSLNTHMEFDARLAKEHSEKNPVFYVQYAHARIASIIAKAKGLPNDGTTLLDVMREPSARQLSLELLKFEEVLEAAADDFHVHRLTSYASALASAFSGFYRDVRIVGDGSYNGGGYALLLMTKAALSKSLGLLGISAPEKM
ncbi:MAG: arginine--tRNA ligase [bacterium]|nr:arginine--tRNA ligase [bacterium]